MISSGAMLPARVLRALSVLLFWGTWLTSSVARAQDGDFERLVYNLANADDFRLRTQAALALGASMSDRAVAPLCGALADSNTTVRAASAAALGRLSPRGEDCLEERLSSEANDVVVETIAKALEPLFAAETKFYISLGKATDKTGRTGSQVEAMVRRAMTSKVRQTAGFLRAPSKESSGDAKRRLGAHPGVKAFFLSPSVALPDYSGGNLKVKLEVAMLTYPDKNLLGSFSVNLTEPGVDPGSVENENDLIRMAAEKAVDKFAGIAPHQ